MGGDHGHGHGSGHPEVPKYTIYKVEDAPILKQLKDSLGRQGLKDPWIRNEVWRFNHPMRIASNGSMLRRLLFRGFGVGFAAFVATIGIEKALGVDWHDPRGLHKDGHGGHH